MTTQEKVMLAVSHCLRSNDCSICENCPYNNGADYGCRARLQNDIITLLKIFEPASIEPKRIDLEEETKAWLDKMDAVDALGNIADICIDWDGYRTADGLGGLINEIWAYARYCADRLMKAQEPVKPKVIDTSISKQYHSDMFKNYYCGNCGEFLHIVNRKDLFCSQCGRAVKWNV